MKFSSVLPICLSFAIISQAAPMNFDKRRFGQEHTPEADALFQEVKDLAQGSDKEAQAGDLSGAMVRALLAKAPACDQQDKADEVIDLGKEFGGEKEQQFIDVAKRYRQLERNTPNAGQPSELCDKPPKNKELDGLVQKQDPTGDAKSADPNPDTGADPNNPDTGADPNNPDTGADPNNPDKGKEADPNKGKEADPKKGKKADPKKGKKADPKKDKKADPKKDKEADPEKDKEADPEKDKEADPEKDKEADPDTGDAENPAETNPVGGVKMPKIIKQDGDFIVNGNGFNGNLDAAHARQCDVQKNQCFNKFNGGDKSFSGQDCEDQVQACKDGPPVFE